MKHTRQIGEHTEINDRRGQKVQHYKGSVTGGVGLAATTGKALKGKRGRNS